MSHQTNFPTGKKGRWMKKSKAIDREHGYVENHSAMKRGLATVLKLNDEHKLTIYKRR